MHPFQVCGYGPGSASKVSDSGSTVSSRTGIPGSLLDSLNDPAVKRLEAMLRVRDRGPFDFVNACPRVIAGSCVPLGRRHTGAVDSISRVGVLSARPRVAGGMSRAARACQRL